MKNTIYVLFVVGVMGLLGQSEVHAQSDTWKSPDEDILKIVHATKLPRTSISPARTHMLLSAPIIYPSLSEMGAPMLKLAGTRVNPKNNYYHGRHGGTSPRILTIKDGKTTKLNIPAGAEVMSTSWTADGQRFALSVGFEDRIELWLGDITGKVEKVPNVVLNPLMDLAAQWFPDQQRLLIRNIAKRGAAPQKPTMPKGPKILEDAGASARSTYEARNLLITAHDDDLFTHYTQCELVVYDSKTKKMQTVGPTASYRSATISPLVP